MQILNILIQNLYKCMVACACGSLPSFGFESQATPNPTKILISVPLGFDYVTASS